MESCNRCNKEKLMPRRFSAENNVDPDEKFSAELPQLNQDKEMFIAQILPMLTVYKLQGGQLGYRGNVIHFAQDIQKFITKLTRNPSTIDTLNIRKPGQDFISFQEFKMIEYFNFGQIISKAIILFIPLLNYFKSPFTSDLLFNITLFIIDYKNWRKYTFKAKIADKKVTFFVND
ncbi:hypothetical protein C2G38_2235069 [Gigaspora rosea]|uniref:DUF6570 domain-containing protein n=1 Tax=Gigaspora rosea TaxID=44941 RepID=A0A397TPW6_9GLOM|nr:hypothetical protein C2G38_2235069 [Gigaspora rosea]